MRSSVSLGAGEGEGELGSWNPPRTDIIRYLLWLDGSSSIILLLVLLLIFYLRCAGLITCKIVRFQYSGKCQCSHKVIKVFGKVVFAVHSSERVDILFSNF
jgi:hypothetical protein